MSDLYGRIYGAGMLLDDAHVLTCAHVVQHATGVRNPAGSPATAVEVRFTGATDKPPTHGIVLDDFWTPPTEADDRGDIAVLELTDPFRHCQGAPLRRTPPVRHQLVRAFGFPAGADFGVWSHAELVGDGGPYGEWVQLNPRTPGERMSHGFSGAAVLDEDTNEVVGMVVSEWRPRGEGGSPAGVSWMIPVETMLGHCPGLDRWVRGERAVDRSFDVRARSADGDLSMMKDIAGWLAEAGPGEVMVIVAEQGALSLTVAFSDRERSRDIDRLRAESSGDAVPPVGSVHLAIDASGRTVNDVRRRIDDRLDIRFHGNEIHTSYRSTTRPRTLVVDAIDEAAEPDRLADDVLRPLVEHAGELCLRAILAFRRVDSPSHRTVSSLLDSRWDDVHGRLDQLASKIDDLGNDEVGIRDRAAKFAAAHPHHDRADRLRIALNQLHKAKADGDLGWVRRKLGPFACAVHREADALMRENATLDKLAERRDELRGRLEICRTRARDHDIIEEEDAELDRLYLSGWDTLWVGPCDLARAEHAVTHYCQAVRRRIGADDGTDGARR